MSNLNNGILAGLRQPGMRVGVGPTGNLVLSPPGGKPGGAGSLASPVWVENYGARGNGLTDDTAAIQAAMNAAGPYGAPVGFTPGRNYLVSQPLAWNTQATAGKASVAPSLIGSPGMSGSSPDAGGGAASVYLTASPSFPAGQFLIDYLGQAGAGAGGNTGFRVSGFVLNCNDLAAGVRSFNSEDSEWADLVIWNTAAPNPAYTGGVTPSGAVSFVANPSYDAWNNRAERIYVYGSAQHAFHLNEGTGSYDFVTNCTSVGAGWAGFYALGNVTISSCLTQDSGQNNPNSGFYHADYELAGALLANSVALGNPKGPGVLCIGEASRYNTVTGCTFRGTSTSGLAEEWAAVAYMRGSAAHQTTFSDCLFITGSHTSDYVYMDGTGTGAVVFDGCQFVPAGGAVTNKAFNLNGAAAYVKFANCPGINPAGSQSISVPSSGTATAALPFDATYYVTAGSGGSCTLAISGGPTITVPASAVVPVLVPAGQTLTPTYSSAPTWVVEGN